MNHDIERDNGEFPDKDKNAIYFHKHLDNGSIEYCLMMKIRNVNQAKEVQRGA